MSKVSVHGRIGTLYQWSRYESRVRALSAWSGGMRSVVDKSSLAGAEGSWVCQYVLASEGRVHGRSKSV